MYFDGLDGIAVMGNDQQRAGYGTGNLQQSRQGAIGNINKALTTGGTKMGQVAAACKAAGMWPFIAGNRVHVVPPCVIDEADFAEGAGRGEVAGCRGCSW